MSNSRIKNTVRNSGVAVSGQLLNNILSFVSRTVFINMLGKAYLGVHGLFSNILTVLSLAELGIGDAIIYKLYKPLAEDDQDSIKKYLGFYKKAYAVIGGFVFIIGLALMPWLHVFIKDPGDLKHVGLIYFLYLIDTSSTYFFAHKKLILNADQKNYVVTFNRYVFLLLRTLLQIIFLLIFKNFIVYLVIQIVVNFVENIVMAIKSDKMYPYARQRGSALEKTEKREIFKQTSALVIHKIGGVCVSGTDNILISSFVGIAWVGLYSNYITIMAIPISLLASIFSPLTASVGNLISTSDDEHIRKTFNKMFFANFWLYSFSAIALFVLLNSFIGEIWLDESYVLSNMVVFFIVLNFYLTGMRQCVSNFKNAAGLFWEDRFRPLAEALVNLVMSIVLLKYIGFVGVIVGTTISLLTTTFWVEAVIVYKKVLKAKPIYFFAKYITYFIITGIVGSLVYFLCALIPFYGILGFIAKTIVCVFVTNGCLLLVFYKKEEFQFFWGQIKKVIFKKRGST